MICSALAKWSYCNYSTNIETKDVDLHALWTHPCRKSISCAKIFDIQMLIDALTTTHEILKSTISRFNLILIWIVIIVLIVTLWSLYNLSVFWYEVFILCFVILNTEVGETIQAFLKFVVFSFCSIWWWRVIGKFLKWHNCALPHPFCRVTV